MPWPDQSRVKAPDNYVGRILATIFSFGIYMFWWSYDMQVDGNRHLEMNWPFDDAVVGAVQALGG